MPPRTKKPPAEPKHTPDPEKVRRGRGARAKGNAYEVEVAHMLEPVYPNAQRGKQQTRNGHDAPDVVRTPWWWECKSYKGQYSARKALTEALADSAKHGGGMVPICAIRKTRERPDLFVMRLEDGIALLARMEAAEKRVAELEDALELLG